MIKDVEFSIFGADTKSDQKVRGATQQNGRLIAKNIEESTSCGKLPSNANNCTMFHIHKIWNRSTLDIFDNLNFCQATTI